MAYLTAVKTADKDYLFIGCDNSLNYMIQINNIGNTSAVDVLLEDIIPSGLKFVSGSLLINGVARSCLDINNGINIGTINPSSSTIVTFDVSIDRTLKVNEISNIGVIKFKDSTNPEEIKTVVTNELIIPVINVNLQVNKNVNKKYALVNDILTFNVAILNKGNIVLKNILFKDILQEELNFVDRSVKINGIVHDSFDPNVGFTLEDINPNSMYMVSFQAQVTKVPCDIMIKNNATIEFEYILPIESTQSANGRVCSNTIVIKVGPSSFKQISVDETLKIPAHKPDAEEILNVNLEIEIIDLNLINTICGLSCEGNRLTGSKLIVNGLLKQVVEYVALKPDQAVHAAEFNVPFSTFIIVPKDFVLSESTSIDTHVEDIYFQLLDKRTIFKNITLFLKTSC